MTTTDQELTTFPQAEDDDPDDVRWAIETGKSMWSKGDHREALRWLRKAAEAASEEGADLRAIALAKAAADRRNALELPVSIPPSTQADGPAEPSSSAPAAAKASGPPSGKRPPPPSKRSKPAAPSGDGAADPLIEVKTAIAADEADDAVTEDGGPASVQPEEPTKEWKAKELVEPASATPAAPGASAQVSSPFIGHQAVRVAYAPPGEDGVFRARALKPDERPPGGTRVALLVSLEADAALFPPSS